MPYSWSYAEMFGYDICLFCLFWVFRPTREFFTYLETSPLLLKDCTFWTSMIHLILQLTVFRNSWGLLPFRLPHPCLPVICFTLVLCGPTLVIRSPIANFIYCFGISEKMVRSCSEKTLFFPIFINFIS